MNTFSLIVIIFIVVLLDLLKYYQEYVKDRVERKARIKQKNENNSAPVFVVPSPEEDVEKDESNDDNFNRKQFNFLKNDDNEDEETEEDSDMYTMSDFFEIASKTAAKKASKDNDYNPFELK